MHMIFIQIHIFLGNISRIRIYRVNHYVTMMFYYSVKQVPVLTTLANLELCNLYILAQLMGQKCILNIYLIFQYL